MVLWVGNVCPPCASSSDTSTDEPKMAKLLRRLCLPTALEIDGWKRLLPIRELFAKEQLDIDHYCLKFAEVTFDLFKETVRHRPIITRLFYGEEKTAHSVPVVITGVTGSSKSSFVAEIGLNEQPKLISCSSPCYEQLCDVSNVSTTDVSNSKYLSKLGYILILSKNK